LLRGWDGRLGPGSAAAALFEVWFRVHLRRDCFTRVLGREDAVEAVMADESVQPDARIVLELVEGDLAPSLRVAMLDLEARLGPDADAWRWGALHRAAFAHPLDGLPGAGPVPRGGGSDTDGNTTYGADYLETVGATARLVLDVGDWDRSVAMNAPGQSGDPSDPHYRDLVGPWSRDESVPLVYTRAVVERFATRRIVLEPIPEGVATGS
jgi:penicillin amidase